MNVAARTALVVGGGIGGLAAAVALRRAGWRVRVFERATERRELGFALNLAPNATAALRELGVAERVLANSAAPERVELRGERGRVLKRLDIARTLGRAQSVVALRRVVHDALFAALDPGDLELGSEVVGFDTSPRGVSIVLADGRSASGEILVGADGVGSVVRRLLYPHEGAPRRSGFAGIRGLAHGADVHLGDLSAVAYFGDGVEAAVARAGGGAIYWYMSLLANDVLAESADIGSIARARAAPLDPTIQGIVAATASEETRIDELFDREPLDGWGRGPVTLLGDAAHPMLPHAGQGAAQALEDAVALALALGREAPPAALRRYEQVRTVRSARVVRLARRIAAVTTTHGRAIRVLRAAAIRLAPARLMLSSYHIRAGEDPHRALRAAGQLAGQPTR